MLRSTCSATACVKYVDKLCSLCTIPCSFLKKKLLADSSLNPRCPLEAKPTELLRFRNYPPRLDSDESVTTSSLCARLSPPAEQRCLPVLWPRHGAHRSAASAPYWDLTSPRTPWSLRGKFTSCELTEYVTLCLEPPGCLCEHTELWIAVTTPGWSWFCL